jgi:hypothetical protein
VKDFITRIAERALGTAPMIDPQATSRYVRAQLPLPQSHLPETVAANVVSHVLPALELNIEPEPAENMIRAGKEIEQEDRAKTNAPHQRQKTEPVLPAEEWITPANEVDSESEFANPESNAPRANAPRSSVPRGNAASDNVSLSLEEPHVIASHPTPSFFEATRVGLVPDESGNANAFPTSDNFETGPNPSRTGDHHSAPRSSSGQNEIPAAAGSEVQKRPSESQARVTEELIVTDSNQIAALQESFSKATVDLFAEPPTPPNVSPLPEHRQITPAAIVAHRVGPPAAISDHHASERPERGERTIQVRIGRLEVRAEPPPVASVEPVSPPAPKVSLAEFLSQHNRRRG